MSHCLNCGEPFPSPRPRYCPACGQESNIRAPTLHEFIQQFGGSYIAAEGALWRTLKLLFLKPGALTREYLAGRRRRYVLPLRLYLTISLVTLVLMRMLAQVQVQLDRPDLEAIEKRSFEVQLGVGSAGTKDGVFYCKDLPEFVCKRLQQRLDVDRKSLGREIAAWGQRLMSHLGAAMFVLLPAYALWLRIVYWNRRLRYTEHLVFALHVHAFWFAMLALMLTDLPWLAGAAGLAVPVYTLLALRSVYGGRWWPLLLRALLVSVLYGLIMAAALTAVAVWALLF